MATTTHYGFNKDLTVLDAVDTELHRLETSINGKVDKQPGSRLIREEELQYLYNELDNRYTKQKVYTQEEVDALLAAKQDKPAPIVERGVDFVAADRSGNYYYKNAFGEVTLKLSCFPHNFATGTVIATIADGYRPRGDTEFPMIRLSHGVSCGTLVVRANGEIIIKIAGESDGTFICSSSVSYLAA